jgi:phospholipid-binding lipoprotein MlaA
LFRVIFILFISFSLLFSQSNEETAFDDFDDEFSVEKVDSSWDPLKLYNIPMTGFNDFVYMYIMGPIAKGYRYVVSKPIREGVSNVFHNIQFPIRVTNNLLQLKFNNALEESARFAINSTYGLAGFIDIAKSEGGIERHDEDFGQTLGFYGMGNDIHIVLPLFGPSNLRDTIGLVGDTFVDPIYHAQRRDWNVFKSNNFYLFVNTYKIGNEYSLHVDEYENIRKDSVDLYILLKSVYEQRRDALIEE